MVRWYRPAQALTALIAAAFFPASVHAEREAFPVELSGFGDIVYRDARDSTFSKPFSIGQFEIDLAVPVEERIDLSAAIAYDGSRGSFGSGGLFIDFNLFGTARTHFRRIRGIDHSGIIVGQFDVPFGIDYLVYPSVDRIFVSAPLAVERTYGFWNDTGVQAYLTNRWANTAVFIVNGFDPGGSFDRASGGRIGFKPFGGMEAGGSHAVFTKSGERDLSLSGADFRVEKETWYLKGEYISRETAPSEGGPLMSGFYMEGFVRRGNPFFAARYDSFSPPVGRKETRTCLVAGYAICERSEFRTEYQARTNGADRLFFQVVADF